MIVYRRAPIFFGAGVYVLPRRPRFPGRPSSVNSIRTPFGFKHGPVPVGSANQRLGQDAVKFFLSESSSSAVGKRETALQLGEQVGRLDKWKRARRDKQDVIRVHEAVLLVFTACCLPRWGSRSRWTLRKCGTLLRTAGELVDFVNEHDAHLLHALTGEIGDLVSSTSLEVTLPDEMTPRRADLHFQWCVSEGTAC